MITIAHESMQIPLLASGKGWLVVDKPAGMTVHNLPGRDLCSIVSAFLRNEHSARKRVHMDPAYGVSPVHRLDRETSGVILLAVDRELSRFL